MTPTGELISAFSPDTASNGKPAVAVIELGRGPFDGEETG
jgi:hypothetical protein